MTRVLIVDDHPAVRVGLRYILESAGDFAIAGEAGTCREARALSRSARWDLILLDLSLPDGDGLEVLDQLKRESPERPVVIVSLHVDRDRAVRALRTGASGYLSKDSPAVTIVDAARRAAAGRVVVSDWLAEHLAARAANPEPDQPHARLSDREFHVMLRLARGQRVTDVAADMCLSVKTVSTYRRRVLEKLGVSSNAELAAYALQQNLLA